MCVLLPIPFFRKRVRAKAAKLQEAQPTAQVYSSDEIILIVSQKDHRLVLKWYWTDHLARGLLFFGCFVRHMRPKLELLGYRRKSGGFASDALSERDNGEQVVHSRHDEELEETLSAGEYFYTFVLTTNETNKEKPPERRLVARFKAPLANQEKTKQVDAKRERHRRAIEEAVRAVDDIKQVKGLRRKWIAKAKRSAEFAASTPEEQQQWLDDIDAIIEQTQVKLSDLQN